MNAGSEPVAVQVRLTGTWAECAAAAEALGGVLDVVGVSDFRPNRGAGVSDRVLGRVYLDTRLYEAGTASDQVASLRAGPAEADARRYGLAVELVQVQHVAARLAEAARAADAALDEEMGDRQGIAERLLKAVSAAVRDLTGYGDDQGHGDRPDGDWPVDGRTDVGGGGEER